MYNPVVFLSSQIRDSITIVDLKTFRTSERYFYLLPLSSHPPKELLMYFLSLWVCLFWTISFIHKEINIFCQWVLSLSRMLSGLSHIVACISTSLLTMAERCYTVWLSVCPVALLCSTLCNPMNYSMPGFLFLHHLLVFDQTHFIELVMPSNHLTLCRPPSPPALNLSQHQGLFQWIGSSHQLARVASFIYWSMDTWVVSTF